MGRCLEDRSKVLQPILGAYRQSLKPSFVEDTLVRILPLLICLVFGLTCQMATAQSGKNSQLNELRTAQISQRASLLAKLQKDPNVGLMDVVAMMGSVDPVQKNLLLGLAQTIYQRDVKKAKPTLQKIVDDKSLDPAARYWAFSEWTSGDAGLRESLLQKMLEDPALELRYEAVKQAQSEVAKLKEKGTEGETLKASYQKLLVAARLPEQIQQIADSLKELGTEVDLLDHFAFIAQWQTIGPFDNRNQAGFNVVYGPEKDYLAGKAIDANAQYDGKNGKVQWQLVSTKEKDGAVDLNPVYKNEKGAITYAYAEFNAPQAVDCQVRLGCINANKVWVNGQEKLANEVYHTGSQIDQYAASVQLKAGKNTILVKCCQNEQTESWAQDWKFQLRFTDASGLPIRPAK